MPATIYPGFDRSAETIAAMRAALRGCPGGTRSKANQLTKYSHGSAEKAKRDSFSISHTTLGDFCEEGSTHIPTKPFFFETLWDWLHYSGFGYLLKQKHPDDYWEDQQEGMAATHSLLGYIDPELQDFRSPLAILAGTYRLFRRSFIHPEAELQICELICGLTERPEMWQLKTLHERSHKVNDAEQAHGCIVPSGEKFLLAGGLIPKIAPVTMIVDPIGWRERPDHITEARGIIMVGAKGRPPSAHPFYMHRVSNTVVPEVIEERDLSLGIFKKWRQRIISELDRNYINSL